jgi:hypothetical protein
VRIGPANLAGAQRGTQQRGALHAPGFKEQQIVGSVFSPSYRSLDCLGLWARQDSGRRGHR